MAVKLRLRRLGRTHAPYYHIVAADSRSPRDGKYIEQVGSYNPLTEPTRVTIDHELTLKWLKNGALPTETVRSILSKEGIMLKLHLHRKGKSDEEIEAEYQRWKLKTEAKNTVIQSTKDSKAKTEYDKRMEQERKKRQERVDKIAARTTKSAVVEEIAPSTEE